GVLEDRRAVVDRGSVGMRFGGAPQQVDEGASGWGVRRAEELVRDGGPADGGRGYGWQLRASFCSMDLPVISRPGGRQVNVRRANACRPRGAGRRGAVRG